MIVGIDNGLDGGLCAISAFDGSIIDKIAMPTMQRSKKREVATAKINEWLVNLNTPFTLAVEEPLAHAKSPFDGVELREARRHGRSQRLRLDARLCS